MVVAPRWFTDSMRKVYRPITDDGLKDIVGKFDDGILAKIRRAFTVS